LAIAKISAVLSELLTLVQQLESRQKVLVLNLSKSKLKKKVAVLVGMEKK